MRFNNVNLEDITKVIEFGGCVDEACNVIQNNTNDCVGCPIKECGYCGADTTLVEMYCIPTEAWKEFFQLAYDIEDNADFESWCEEMRCANEY